MSLIIRELSTDDNEEYINLINQLRAVNCIVSKEKFTDLHATIFKSNKIFVAELENKLVGTITLIIDQKFIHNCSVYTRIEDLVVDINFRKRDVGFKLVEYAINYSKNIGAYKITLICKKELISFYNKNDFIEHDIHMMKLL